MLRGDKNTKTITMDYGDYGLNLPITITKGDVSQTDVIKFTIAKTEYSDPIHETEYNDIQIIDGKPTFNISFTQEESEKLKEGTYVYGLKQYRNGQFLNTIVNQAQFIVDKGV